MSVSEAPMTIDVAGDQPSEATAPLPTNAAAPRKTGLRAEITRLLRSGAPWVVFGRFMGAAATALASAMLTRLLSADDYGRFLLFSTVTVFGSALALFGLNGAGLRFVSERLGAGDHRGAGHALRLSLLVAGAAMMAVAVLVYVGLVAFGAEMFHEPRLRDLAPLIVAYIVCFASLQLVAELLRGFHDLRFASLLAGQSGGTLANCLFTLLLVVSLPLGVMSLAGVLTMQLIAVAFVVPFALAVLYYTARTRLAARSQAAGSHAKAPLPPLTLRQLLRVCSPLMLTQLLLIATAQADIWVGGATFSMRDLALYGATRRLMVLVAIPTQMAVLTSMSMIPALYVQRRLPDLQRLVQSAAALAAVPSIAALLLLLLAPGWTLGLMFGGFYREAAAPLVILVLGQAVYTWAGLAGDALAITGHHHVVLAVNGTIAVIYVLVTPLAAAHFGMIGLAAASSSIMALQSLTMWCLAKKFMGIWTNPSLKACLAGSTFRRAE